MSGSVLWRRGDRFGAEFARLERARDGWRLEGVAIFVHEKRPCRLDYTIESDSSWATRTARVRGQVGAAGIDTMIEADGRGAWALAGSGVASVAGCIDIDLNFSPSTNLLPIRRLELAVGERREVRAAWLRFPEFTLEPLAQAYTRLAERTYRYESLTGFSAELLVDGEGLPLKYGDVWIAEAGH